MFKVESLNDQKHYELVNKALAAAKFAADEIKTIWQLVASIITLVRLLLLYSVISHL